MDETRRPLSKRERHAVPLTLRFLVRAANLDPFGVVNLGSAGKPKRCHIIDKHTAQLYIPPWTEFLEFIHSDLSYSKAYFTGDKGNQIYGSYGNITRLFTPATQELERLGLLSFSKRDGTEKLSKSGPNKGNYLALKLINLPDSGDEEACLSELDRKQRDELLYSLDSQSYLEHPDQQSSTKSRFYVSLPEEEQFCYSSINKRRAFLRISAPEKMGKTSLIGRIVAYANSQKYKTVEFDLNIHRDALLSPGSFLRALGYQATRQLGVDVNLLDEYWNPREPNISFTTFFEDVLLEQLNSPFILFIDNLDQLFFYPDTAGIVLPIIRGVHEASKSEQRPRWEKIRWVISHSTTYYAKLDIRVSPFNIGDSVKIPELSYEQTVELSSRYGLAVDSSPIRSVVGGHPYLLGIAFYYLASERISLDELVATASKDNGIYANHLRELSEIIESNVPLKESFLEVIKLQEPMQIKKEHKFQLHRMGIVEFDEDEDEDGMVFRCKLYRDYFCRTLSY